MRVRFCILVALVITLISSVSFAAQDDERWRWVNSDDVTSVYVDAKSVSYNPESDIADFTTRVDMHDKQMYSLNHMRVFYKLNKIGVLEIKVYQMGTDKFLNEMYSGKLEDIVPYTAGDNIAILVSELVHRDEKQHK